MARLFRRYPSSAGLSRPRVFVRVFCEPGALVETVAFYRSLTGVALDMDMDVPEAGLHVVGIGPFLILELDSSKHELAVQTHATVLNADLDAAVSVQVANGATIVQQRFEGPAGPGARLRHPDGLLVEYLEHRPQAGDADTPTGALAPYA